MSLLFNMLSRLVITFLPRSKHLLIPWLQSPSAVISKPRKIKSDTVSAVSPSICHEVMGLDIVMLVFWMLNFKPTFSLSSEILRQINCCDYCWEPPSHLTSLKTIIPELLFLLHIWLMKYFDTYFIDQFSSNTIFLLSYLLLKSNSEHFVLNCTSVVFKSSVPSIAFLKIPVCLPALK